MNIIFWQNCLSPHQLPYIVHLIDDKRVNRVVIVAGETINRSRKDMGWDLTSFPGLEKCDVYLNPNIQTIKNLLSTNPENSYHLFSGVRGFKFVFRVFKLSLKYNLKRGMITESPNTYAFGRANGKPLWLHWLRWKLQDSKYISRIDTVFAMGEDAVSFYRTLSQKWKVYPFGYCTFNGNKDEGNKKSFNINYSQMLKVVFVGSLSWRKSVDTLLISAKIMQKEMGVNNIKITIIGDGPERFKLEKLVYDNQLSNIFFIGTQKQSSIPQLLKEQDVFVLPSIYDGWGAVVNEALQAGLYTICSDKCGAKDLLADSRCGEVFKAGNSKQLANILTDLSRITEGIRSQRQWRIEWSQRAISGRVMAKYLINNLFDEPSICPWYK